ncbi:uncharacterized protein TNCV_2756801 [Trichonephila clavipes]|nr:uncharacterized protein TNCV_2756801 [Trichonephila clavipes]
MQRRIGQRSGGPLTCGRPSNEYEPTQEADATPFTQRHLCPVFGRAVDFPLRTSHVLLLEIERRIPSMLESYTRVRIIPCARQTHVRRMAPDKNTLQVFGTVSRVLVQWQVPQTGSQRSIFG